MHTRSRRIRQPFNILAMAWVMLHLLMPVGSAVCLPVHGQVAPVTPDDARVHCQHHDHDRPASRSDGIPTPTTPGAPHDDCHNCSDVAGIDQLMRPADRDNVLQHAPLAVAPLLPIAFQSFLPPGVARIEPSPGSPQTQFHLQSVVLRL